MKATKILLLAGLTGFLVVNFCFAQTWTQTSAPNTNWVSLAGSADGTKLIAAVRTEEPAIQTNIYHGNICISSNSGATWTQVTNIPDDGWMGVASSADGTKFVATEYYGGVYISTNSGATWTRTGGNNTWSCVASSADGKKLVAGTYFGGVYTNDGTNWVLSLTNNDSWVSISSSTDGTKLIARNLNNSLWRSTNSGATWVASVGGMAGIYFVALSADGNKSVALGNGGQIYVSTNSGAIWKQTWAPQGTTNVLWQGVCISSDGNRMFAGARVSGFLTEIRYVLFVSTDSGTTWTEQSNMPANVFFAVSTADGGRLEAAFYPGGIWTWQNTLVPQMNITPANRNLTLSWLVPSTNFVLQQSADLSGWTDVTNQPVLNLTNLQEEVSLPLSGSNSFFRLKTP